MDYEAMDRAATLRAKAAIASQSEPFTLMDLCQAIRQPYPYTDEDLDSLAAICRAWNIRTNMDDEPSWQRRITR